MQWLRRATAMASDVTCGSFDVLAIFELAKPGIGLFLSQVQAGGLVVIPSRERSLTKLIADHLSLNCLVHEQNLQSMRGVPRRSTSPVRPKKPISANAMRK